MNWFTRFYSYSVSGYNTGHWEPAIQPLNMNIMHAYGHMDIIFPHLQYNLGDNMLGGTINL